MMVMLTFGFTLTASFNDQETSNANDVTVWASTLWTQTSQADFEAGVSDNVNTLSSPGDVSLVLGGNGGGNLILLWDGGTAPTGWTVITTFNTRFPRGAATYSGIGGAASHTHTVTLVSSGGPSANTSVSGSGTNRASGNHTHTLSSASTPSASNLPSYRDLKFIRYSGVAAVIPAGAIAIFDTTPPAGWTRYSAQDNFFVRGAATTNVTGGSNNHTHTVPNLAASTSYQAVSTTTPRTLVATSAHTHTVATPTDSVDNQSPFITVILAKADSDTTIPYGMIGMFDATPTGGWSVLSGVGGPFESRFIVGGSSYGTTSGAVNHTHSNLTTPVANSSANGNASTSSANASAASHPHIHSVTLSFDSVSHLPPYRDVIFAKAVSYPPSGTIASQVLDTTIASSRWDGLSWDKTLPSGTNTTFEVRARNTSFTASAGTPAWVSVGGTSPVITGLPSGRYKQWRATLTPDGPKTSTPILQEVRVYYYGD
ncbi:MAG: hypothetical protein HW402_1279 [Dehalococcoidales bacterium]|nr:hypothetical protein [Dehalococcoidales bacterium]